MNVLLLTSFIGLILAILFVVLFLYQMETRKFSSNERESLMPLQKDQVRPANPKSKPYAE
jgi:hypothetical protein